MKINFPLLALAIGAFAIGTTEFSPMGFLPEIAQDFNISIPRAGMLISAYALGGDVGCTPHDLVAKSLPKTSILNFIDGYF